MTSRVSVFPQTNDDREGGRVLAWDGVLRMRLWSTIADLLQRVDKGAQCRPDMPVPRIVEA